MDIRQSDHYSKYIRSLGWEVETAGKAKVFIRHFPIFYRWSVIKVQRPENIDFPKLDQIAKDHHALFVKLEPNCHPELVSGSVKDSMLKQVQHDIIKYGYTADSWPLLPSKTLVLDLNLDLNSLPKDTRYEIRRSMKNHITIQPSSNIELFYKLLQETMKIGKWNIPIHKEVVSLWKSFQPNNSQILIAYHNKTPVGGCLLIWHENTAHYMYAALTNHGRNTGAAYLTLFEAVRFLKNKEIQYLDLEGIYDERFAKSTKNWLGFTRFKMGWGGTMIEYPKPLTKYYNLFAKLLFSLDKFV